MLGRLGAIVAGTVAFVACAQAWEFQDAGSNPSARVIPATTISFSGEDAEQNAEGGYALGSLEKLNPDDYKISTPCQSQKWTISPKKAASIYLSFDNVNLGNGDQLVVTPSKGGNSVIVNPSQGPVRTNRISGSSVDLEYKPSSSCSPGSSQGFSLTGAGITYSKEWLVKKEAVCGASNTMKNIKCFEASGDSVDQLMAKKSKAVLRTERVRDDNKIVVCTAWLWGNQGHIISNHHCFSSQAMVDASFFHFGVESNSCESTCSPGSCPIEKSVNGRGGVKFISSDPDVDISILQLTSDASSIVSKYGYLQIRFGSPDQNEQIYIPQHPGGGARMIAKTDDDADSTIATIKQVDCAVEVSGTTYKGLIGYSADTENGSSGSPVISLKNHQVVGIHRIGYCNNAATPSDRMLNYLVPKAGNNDGIVV